jgi:hypothetical protein
MDIFPIHVAMTADFEIELMHQCSRGKSPPCHDSSLHTAPNSVPLPRQLDRSMQALLQVFEGLRAHRHAHATCWCALLANALIAEFRFRPTCSASHDPRSSSGSFEPVTGRKSELDVSGITFTAGSSSPVCPPLPIALAFRRAIARIVRFTPVRRALRKRPKEACTSAASFSAQPTLAIAAVTSPI